MTRPALFLLAVLAVGCGSGRPKADLDRAKTAVYVSSKQEISMRGQEQIAQAVELVDAILDARRAA